MMGKKALKRGSAMMITVVIVLILFAVAAAVLTQVVWSYRQTGETLENDEAMIIARAGLEKARIALYLYRTTNAWDPSMATGEDRWNDILEYNAGQDIPGGVDVANRVFTTDLELIKTNLNALWDSTDFVNYRQGTMAAGTGLGTSLTPAQTSNDVIFGKNQPYRGGGYHVIVRDNTDSDPVILPSPYDPLLYDTDRVLVVTVTSTLRDGTQRQLEALCTFEPPVFLPTNALLANGDLLIQGSAKITGANGNIFSNEDIEAIGGSNSVAGKAGAVGTVDPGVNAGGGTKGGQASTPIPNLNPSSFSNNANYKFDASGNVFWNNGGVFVQDTPASKTDDPPTGSGWDGSGKEYFGFNFNKSQGWTFSGSGASPPPATYYFLTDATISGMGSSGVMEATFLVEGNLKFTGNGTFSPYLADVSAVVSGTMYLSGTSGGLNEGFWGAAGATTVTGSAKYVGSIVSSSLGDSKTNAIDASAEVEYNNLVNTMIEVASEVRVQSIRRLK